MVNKVTSPPQSSSSSCAASWGGRGRPTGVSFSARSCVKTGCVHMGRDRPRPRPHPAEAEIVTARDLCLLPTWKLNISLNISGIRIPTQYPPKLSGYNSAAPVPLSLLIPDKSAAIPIEEIKEGRSSNSKNIINRGFRLAARVSCHWASEQFHVEISNCPCGSHKFLYTLHRALSLSRDLCQVSWAHRQVCALASSAD